MKLYYAFCWASGLIQFGDKVPDGAIPLCHGARTTVVREVTVAARHGYKGELLVPGVVEASTQKLKGDALGVWLAWCGGDRSSRHLTWSHMDSRGKFRDPAQIDRVVTALHRQMERQLSRRACTACGTRPAGSAA